MGGFSCLFVISFSCCACVYVSLKHLSSISPPCQVFPYCILEEITNLRVKVTWVSRLSSLLRDSLLCKIHIPLAFAFYYIACLLNSILKENKKQQISVACPRQESIASVINSLKLTWWRCLITYWLSVR